MGNTSSGVTSGVKNQVNSGSCEVYKFADLKGGGELIRIAKKIRLSNSDDYSELDETILKVIPPFLYNGGEGKHMSINAIINQRHMERTGAPMQKQHFRHESTTGVWNWGRFNSIKGMYSRVLGISKPTISPVPQLALNTDTHKEVCWDLKKRGSVGETALHVCFLCGTNDHMIVAQRLLNHFPKLVNDVYLGDDYFGESVLHIAIVNEDPMYVRILLEYNVDVHQRCCGNFFTADDQKSSRHDTFNQEWVDLSYKTNYQGRMYWGEYPLSFAVRLEQDISFRLLVAKGADPNKQDANGNTVLHITVIHRKERMLDLCLSAGAKLNIKNRQGLTPLTLAAKLAENKIYQSILMKEREIYWDYGDAICAGYPLLHMDSIEPGTGKVNKNSVLALVVYGPGLDYINQVTFEKLVEYLQDSDQHLELLDGVLENLLKKKWEGFAKKRLYMQLTQFLVYFLATLVAVILRPTYLGAYLELVFSAGFNNDTMGASNSTCHLMQHSNQKDIWRFMCELCALIGSSWFIYQTYTQIKYVGIKLYIQSLTGFPAKALFLVSCSLVMLMLPLRILCWSSAEDVVCIVAILLNACQFLFFCRGFKLSGPFVLMIYKIIAKDLLRFFMIYSIFVAGFSQGDQLFLI